MGRRLRSRLDILHPDLSGKVEDKQLKQKQSRRQLELSLKEIEYLRKILPLQVRNGYQVS